MTLKITEKERVLQAIERIERKRDAANDEKSRWYFSQCLIGWRQHLARLELERESQSEPV